MTAPDPTQNAETSEGTLTWNYRVVRDEHGTYTVQEVFYREDGSIAGWCGSSLLGETLDELRDDFEAKERALHRPVLVVTETDEGDSTLVSRFDGSSDE